MSDLTPKWVRSAPNGINPGLLRWDFSTFWLKKMCWNLIIKRSELNLSHSVPIWLTLYPNLSSLPWKNFLVEYYSLSTQKWTSANVVKGSKLKIFIGLQYELITIAPNHYTRPVKSVEYANNCEVTNKILLMWTQVWYSRLIGHNTTNTLNNTVKYIH